MDFLLFRPLLSKVKYTPLHPQWFAFTNEKAGLRDICRDLSGIVVDVGCADGKPKNYLAPDIRYIGIDHFVTASQWYRTKPDVFADAAMLPISGESIDHFLLLDVLEHLPNPDQCLSEIFRCLKPLGSITIQVPFLYPIHDPPLDFHRWTRFGLRRAADRHGYSVQKEWLIGHPMETAALNSNIALSKTVLNWIERKHVLGLAVLFLPFIIVFNNILAWAAAKCSETDELMPFGYRVVWRKIAK